MLRAIPRYIHETRFLTADEKGSVFDSGPFLLLNAGIVFIRFLLLDDLHFSDFHLSQFRLDYRTISHGNDDHSLWMQVLFGNPQRVR